MKKQTTSINELCYGFPIQFAQYLTYVRNLKFDETPDYKYLINLMDKALISISVEEDGHFDWMDLNGGKGWDAALNKKANLHGYGNPHPPAHYRKHQQQLQQQQQQQQLQNSQNQPLLGRSHSRNNSASSPRNNNNRFGYQSIQQNQQDSRNIQFLNNNSRFTQQQYLQNGMIPVRDNEELHSDTSSFNRKKNRSCLSWIFCCCY